MRLARHLCQQLVKKTKNLLDRNIRTAYTALYNAQDVKKMLERSREDLVSDVGHAIHLYLVNSINKHNLTPLELEEIFRDVIVYIACVTDTPREFLYSLSLTLNGFTDGQLDRYQETVRKYHEP